MLCAVLYCLVEIYEAMIFSDVVTFNPVLAVVCCELDGKDQKVNKKFSKTMLK